MDPAVVVLVALVAALAGGLIVALFVASRRGAALRRVRTIAGGSARDDVAVAVEAALASRSAAADEARKHADDLGYLVGLVGVGVVRFGADLRIELANPAAYAFLDRPAGGLEGRTVMEAFADHEIEALVQGARERGANNGEFTRPGREGRALVVRARRSPVAGVWVVLEDVTELRRLQRIRSEFVDNLSHELRTPLTNVRLLTETLTRELDEAAASDRVRERVAKIDVETGHLVQMVNELLDLSRIEGGRAQLYLDVVDVSEIVRGGVDRLRLFAERQGVHLDSEVEPDLPLVNGDAERLAQVLANLLHNAVKFSALGTTVTVRAARRGDSVEVAVQDHGPGIAAKDQARIFERFYKVDRARVRGKGGTGLGLAIARHIVEAHGGRIRVESQEGIGSTFTFSLPVPASVPATAASSIGAESRRSAGV